MDIEARPKYMAGRFRILWIRSYKSTICPSCLKFGFGDLEIAA
ncbi:hypothetical protein GXM_04941 [Nostoc sphaeroides CCNUC1]|uniref:Uncharacterized protein n=1 Tax=Nostoc sphaeroides CCNUC1 TaxID=2653204 RepID=A0A5P8W609_9NOSO|nr:hypothetical protein GXM_04941 [Nostoc sphaeroides CCNUC1]